jgi:hypothetical protein
MKKKGKIGGGNGTKIKLNVSGNSWMVERADWVGEGGGMDTSLAFFPSHFAHPFFFLLGHWKGGHPFSAMERRGLNGRWPRRRRTLSLLLSPQ